MFIACVYSAGLLSGCVRKGCLRKVKGYPDKHDLSFHYAPYNFDSEPERSYVSAGIIHAQYRPR